MASLKYKSIAVAVSLSSINFFGILAAVVFLGEVFLWKHLLSLAIATIGILIISIHFNDNRKKIKFDFHSILLPILASVFWGVGYTLFKISLQWMGALTLGIVIETVVLLVALLLIIKCKKLSFKNFINAYTITPHFYIAGLLLMMGSLFINIALTKMSIATVNILGFFTFPVSIVSAYVISREISTIKEWVGIVFIISSIIFLVVVK